MFFLSRLELAGGYQALQGLQIQYAVREYIRVKYFKIYLIERSALPYKWSRAVKMRRWMNHIGSQVTAAAAAAAMLSHPSAPKCTQRCNEGPGQCSPMNVPSEHSGHMFGNKATFHNSSTAQLLLNEW